MKIRMAKRTFDYRYKHLEVGRIVEIDDVTAERWIKNKIATEVVNDGRQTEQGNTEGFTAQEEQGSHELIGTEKVPVKAEEKPTKRRFSSMADIKAMNKAQLYKEAVLRGLPVHGNMNKAEIMEKILGA